MTISDKTKQNFIALGMNFIVSRTQGGFETNPNEFVWLDVDGIDGQVLCEVGHNTPFYMTQEMALKRIKSLDNHTNANMLAKHLPYALCGLVDLLGDADKCWEYLGKRVNEFDLEKGDMTVHHMCKIVEQVHE
jgi:hypothetical protein